VPLLNQKTTREIQESDTRTLNDLVRFLRAEVAQAKPIAANSQKEYSRRWDRLTTENKDERWDMSKAGQSERYTMRAAGVWVMRDKIRELLTEADKIQRGKGHYNDREAERGKVLAKAYKWMVRLDQFRAKPWKEYVFDEATKQNVKLLEKETKELKALKQEASHKKRAATDEQLSKFFAAVGSSQFRQAFLVTEFTGCRGEELGRGVRIEAATLKDGSRVLSFFIETAKTDGNKKGIPVRKVVSVFPAKGSPEVQARWNELADAAKSKKNFVVTAAETGKQTAGQRFTQNFRNYAKKAELKISAYSLRHRVSSQAKSCSGATAENTALVLGHQSVETQRHYGRAQGGISPATIIGVSVSGEVPRGRSPQRVAARDAMFIGAAVASPPPIKQKPRGPRL